MNIEAAYETSPEEFAKRFEKLIEVFAEDKKSNALVMQCLLFKKMAVAQPEVWYDTSIWIDRKDNPQTLVLPFYDFIKLTKYIANSSGVPNLALNV